MTLCPIHHHEATVEAMPETEQRHLQERPFNIDRGYVNGQLKVNHEVPVLLVGTNQFVGEGAFFLVDGESLLSLSVTDGRLEVSLTLYDQQDRLIAEIQRNEWMAGDPLPWDLESSFQWLVIRNRSREVVLDLDARDPYIQVKATLWRRRQRFDLSPRSILFNGVLQNVGFTHLCLVALRLSANTASVALSIEPDPRIGKGLIVSWPDVGERIARGLEGWNRLREGQGSSRGDRNGRKAT